MSRVEWIAGTRITQRVVHLVGIPRYGQKGPFRKPSARTTAKGLPLMARESGRPVSRILLYPAIHLREIPGLPRREAAPTSPGRSANRPYRQFGLLAPVVYLAGPSGFRLGMPPVGSYPTLSPITCDRQRSYRIHRLVCSLLHLTWRRACAHPSLGLLGRAASATSPDFALRFGPKPRNAATGRTARTGWIIPQESTLELLAFPRLRRTILVGVRRSSTLSVLLQRFCQRGSLPISGSNHTPGPSGSSTPS